jgi:hypothetical protein
MTISLWEPVLWDAIYHHPVWHDGHKKALFIPRGLLFLEFVCYHRNVVSRISEMPNPVSAQIIREFYQYTKESNSSEKHMTNALIMTVVNDSMEEKKVIETICKNSNAHGKIFVSELKDAIDFKSGQRGESVLQK